MQKLSHEDLSWAGVTLEYKKNKMLVAKNYCITFVLILFFQQSFTQQIKGDYQRKDPLTAVRGNGIHFNFDVDSSFVQSIFFHTGEKKVLKGTYSILGDTLLLRYIPFKKKSEKTVRIVEKESTGSNNNLNTSIQVFSEENIPMAGVHMLVRNNKDKVIMAFVSNEEGFFPDLHIFDPYVDNFHFSYIGHNEVMIKTDSLFGFETKINISLSDNRISYNTEEKVLKYLIKKISENEIRLVSLKDKEKVLLKRVEEE